MSAAVGRGPLRVPTDDRQFVAEGVPEGAVDHCGLLFAPALGGDGVQPSVPPTASPRGPEVGVGGGVRPTVLAADSELVEVYEVSLSSVTRIRASSTNARNEERIVFR